MKKKLNLNIKFSRILKKISNKNTCIIRGNFNVIHSGHLRIFKMAKKLSNFLIIFLNKDNPKTFIEINERYRVLNTIKLIDYIHKENCTYLSFLEKIKPNIIIKGNEHKKLPHIEEKILKKYNGKIIFSEGQKKIRDDFYKKQITLINKENLIGIEQRKYLKTFFNRRNISILNLKSKIEKFSKKIMVLGDVILDEYIDCELIGTSKEEPTMVISPIASKKFIGGAGIVAKHLSAAGCEVNFISILGKDNNGNKIFSDFNKTNIKSKFLTNSYNPTIVKKRYKIDDRSLIKINNIKRYEIDHAYEKKLYENFIKLSKNIDHLIFSDFSYGILSSTLIEKITSFCNIKKIPFSADAQSSSQIGNILKYKGATLITPTEYEVRLSLADNISGVANLSNKLIKLTNCRNLILKLGPEGILIFVKEKNNIINDTIPALNSSPLDPSGAGDSMLAYTALGLTNNLNIWEASFLGSVAATIQVSRRGNKPINQQEILSLLNTLN